MAMITSQVKLGVTSEDVGTVQTLLKAKGLYLGKPDNKCGPKTVAAIKEFQAKMTYFVGKVPDGAVSPGGPTWQALNSTVGTGLKMSPLVRGLVRQIESRPEVLAARAAVVAGGWALKTVKAAINGSVRCKKCGANIALTEDFLKKIAPSASNDFIQELIKCSTELFPKYGINTCSQIKLMLGQAKKETSEFKAFRESLLYTSRTYTAQKLYAMAPTAIDDGFKRINKTFPDKQAKLDWIMDHLISNDKGYAEHCFGGPLPGRDYRGRGLLHLTHYANYKACASATGHAVDSQPELVENNPRVIIESGLWFWQHKGLGKVADGNDKDKVYTISYKVTGSKDQALQARRNYTAAISKVFNELIGGCKND